jgi:hypothetical protein
MQDGFTDGSSCRQTFCEDCANELICSWPSLVLDRGLEKTATRELNIAVGFLIFRSDAARYILNSCEAAIELTLQSLDAGCR